MKKAVLSFSGGLDSSTLLLNLLANNYDVTAISFFYGQKHQLELDRAQKLVEYLRHSGIGLVKYLRHSDNGFVTDHNLQHQVITLNGLSELLNSSLVTGGSDVPEGHYASENMKDTVVPNRNKIFSSIIQAVALSIATKDGKKQSVDIALGIHADDHLIYPDCRQEFRDADMQAFKIGNWDSELVNYYTPYLYGTKYDILKDGELCCQKLGLDFNEVYKRTNTSYKPIQHNEKWYSDYKSASSVERLLAFHKLGRKDPVEYANEISPVTYEIAVKHALKIENDFIPKISSKKHGADTTTIKKILNTK